MSFLPSPPPATIKGGAGVATEQMRADWQAYFSGTVPGTIIPWAAGTLTLLPNGQSAMYAPDAKGGLTRYLLDRQSIDNPNVLQMMVAMYPGVALAWESYGILGDTEMKAFFDAERAAHVQNLIDIAAEKVRGGITN